MREHNINVLSGPELEIAIVGFELERHGVRGNLLTIY
jgi:hypothetical protein